MKKAILGLIVFLLTGCGAGFEFSSLFSPKQEESSVTVIYPAEQGGPLSGSSMVQSYGESWDNVSAEHPEYSFN